MYDRLLWIREQFKQGSTVTLKEQQGEGLPAGSKGKIKYIDNVGTVFIKWSNGMTLGMPADENLYDIQKKDMSQER